jgi:membrane fusion protein (multidrug efflux system)
MSSKIKFFTLLALLGLTIALSGCFDDGKKEKAAIKAVPLKVIKVKTHDVPIKGEYVGQIAATKTVDIKSRVQGYLEKWTFKEGQLVQKGDVLFLIDPRQYKEALKQANAELARTRASLRKATTDYRRFQALLKQGAVSREEFDTKSTDKQVLEAQLDNDMAAVASAKLNLGYTTISAPMDGIIGRTQVNIGDLIKDETLTKISSIDPVYVNFSIPEKEYLIAIREIEKKKKAGEKSPIGNLQMILADGGTYPHNGTFSMADRAVDSSTGTLGIRAVFPNPEHILRDGQYAKVVTRLKTFKDALTVPARAVLDTQGSKSLLVVSANSTVIEKSVKIAYSNDKLSIIESGINDGALIIADGVKKIRPGTRVEPEIVDDPTLPGKTADSKQ